MKVNTVVLTEIINGCINLSMNGAVKQEQRTEFLALAKRLRGTLLNLLTVIFEDGTPEVVKANNDLQKVNDQISEAKANFDNIADTVTQVGALVGVLDDLLKIAMKFV